MLKDVVAYLRNTITLPLRYTRKPSRVSMLFAELASGDAALVEFHSHNISEGASRNVRLCNMHPDPLANLTDSSYAPPNEKNRRSVSERCHYQLGHLIAWRSKLQPLTAASTHEAELIAMFSAADESNWLRSLLLECGFVIPSISGFYEMPSSKETPRHRLTSVVCCTHPAITIVRWQLGIDLYFEQSPDARQRQAHASAILQTP